MATITKGFNAVLFAYFCYVHLVLVLFKPIRQRNTPWDDIYASHPLVAIFLAVLLVAILLLWGSTVVKSFWNRWAANVFQVRQITNDEAMAILLMVVVLA